MLPTIPDVVDDEVTRACQKLGLEPRFLFDRLAVDFSNQIEVATEWQKKWMRTGVISLPLIVRQRLGHILDG